VSEITPYLAIISAEKRSGKTTLLDALSLIVRRPLMTANISDAALFRAISMKDEETGDELPPTLLFDEIDAIYGPKARDREDLRGLINSGQRRGMNVLRCGGKNNTTLEQFAVFCPKALAGIGSTTLPDTIMDRSIRIAMQRKSKTETVERFRLRDATERAEPIRAKLAAWAVHALPALEVARPELPDELDDRAQDGWEPLLAVADLAEGAWPAGARATAVRLSQDRDGEESYRIQLLARIRAIVDERSGEQRIKTNDLIKAISEDEELPFGDWWAGDKPAPGMARRLAKILKEYGIRSKDGRYSDGARVKGYDFHDFSDVFERYLPERKVSRIDPRHDKNPRQETPHEQTVVADVADVAEFPAIPDDEQLQVDEAA
jgi:hypothetical protein